METDTDKREKKSEGQKGTFQDVKGEGKSSSILSKTSMSSLSTATNSSGLEESWRAEPTNGSALEQSRPSTERMPLEVQLQKIILSGEAPGRDGTTGGQPGGAAPNREATAGKRRQAALEMHGGGKETEAGPAAAEGPAGPPVEPQENGGTAGRGEQTAEATSTDGPTEVQHGQEEGKGGTPEKQPPGMPLTAEDARLLVHNNRQLQAELLALRDELAGTRRRHDQRARQATQTLGDLQRELRRTQAELEKCRLQSDSELIRSSFPGRPPSQPTGHAWQRRKSTAQDSRGSQVTYLRVPDDCFPAPASKKPMSALNVDDVMRTNQRVLEENEVLRDELQRLRQDNRSLLRLVKWLAADNRNCMNHIHTSLTDRRDLTNKLHKEKTETKKLHSQLQQRAHAWVRGKQREEGLEEEERWNRISHISVLGARGRANANPEQKFYTRTVPVSDWADPFSRPDYLGTR